MHSMQGPPSKNERIPPSLTGQSPRSSGQVIKEVGLSYLVTVAFCAVLIFLVRKRHDGTTYKLQAFHHTTQGLQAVARWSGQMALYTEQRYNDTVNTLH